MRRWFCRGLLIAGLVLPAAACGDNNASTPTQPAETFTDSFSGTLTQNGGVTHQFTVKAAGTVTATLTSLAPDSTLRIGLSLGNWNGSACQVVVANDNATQGTVVPGTIATASAPNLCVRVYDASGTVTDPVTYTVQVVHP